MDQQALSAPPLSWGVAGRALPGQAESGDAFVVAPAAGQTLVAVIDGLGHGPDAAAAARIAVATLEAHATEPLEALVRRCHQALLRTRGVVLSVGSFHAADDTLHLLGVGNVEGVLMPADPTRRRDSVLMRGGAVGYQLPPLRASMVQVAPGDVLVLATDGIAADFIVALDTRGEPQEIAERILAQHKRDTDDALVLVVRYGDRRP